MSFIEFDKSERKIEWSMNKLHSHTHYEVYFLLKGTRSFFLSNALFTLEAGTLVVIPPFAMHKTEGGPFERININVSPEFLDGFQKKVLDDLAQNICIKLNDKNLKEIKNILKEIESVDKLQKYSQNLTKTLFGYLVFILSKINKGNTAICKTTTFQNTSPLVLKIIDYLNKNYDKNISLATLESKFFLSKTSLCKQFNKETNCTIKNYLLNIRLNKAQFYLTKTKKSILEISEICGFCSQNYFGLIFKQKIGLSPLNYRKHQQNKSV